MSRHVSDDLRTALNDPSSRYRIVDTWVLLQRKQDLEAKKALILESKSRRFIGSSEMEDWQKEALIYLEHFLDESNVSSDPYDLPRWHVVRLLKAIRENDRREALLRLNSLKGLLGDEEEDEEILNESQGWPRPRQVVSKRPHTN